MRYLATFLGMLLAAAAYAEPPKAVIDGPETAQVGDLICLDATGSVGTSKSWEVWPELSGSSMERRAQLEWFAQELRKAGHTVTPPESEDAQELRIFDGGNQLVLPSHPGLYRIMLAVSNADGIATKRWTLKISGTVPTPTPVPVPVPVPVPPVPVPVPSTLIGDVTQAVAAAVTAQNRDEFDRLSQLYDKLAAQADAGTITSAEVLQVVTNASATVIVTNGKAAWQNIQSAVIAPRLKALQDAGKLVTVPQYATVWREIAAGIKAGLGAQPPPVPVPDPPAPIPTAGLRVLIVREYGDAAASMPASQSQIFTSSKVLGWLESNAKSKWRIWDANGDAAAAPVEFQSALKRPRTSLPWIVVSNGATGFEGPLPKTADETVALMEKYKP